MVQSIQKLEYSTFLQVFKVAVSFLGLYGHPWQWQGCFKELHTYYIHGPQATNGTNTHSFSYVELKFTTGPFYINKTETCSFKFRSSASHCKKQMTVSSFSKSDA